MAALAALGFQAILECRGAVARQKQKRVLIGMLIFAGVLLIAWLATLGSQGALIGIMGHAGEPTPEQLASVRHDFLWALFFSTLAIGLFGMTVLEKGSSRWLQTGIVAVAFVNLWIVSRQIQPTLPGGFYVKQPDAVIKQLATDPQYRTWTPYSSLAQYLYGEKRLDALEWARASGGITADWALHGIYGTTPVGFGLSRYGMLAGAIGQAQPAISEKLADLLSIKQMVTGAPFDQALWHGASREFKVGRRPNPLPRAFVTSQWRTAPDGDTALRTLLSDSLDPHREAVLELLPEAPTPETPATGANEFAPVKSLVDHQESVVIEASASRRSLLVLGDNWFPGWQVSVDGARQPIYRANYAFRGVFLEPGEHRVEFTYKPGSFRAGLAVGILAAIVCLGMSIIARFKPAPGSVPVAPPTEVAATSIGNSSKSRNTNKRKKR